MSNLVTLQDIPAAAIAGSNDVFSVEHIFCIDRKYEAHARELGTDSNCEAPFLTKEAQTLVATGSALPYPFESRDPRFEADLLIAIGTPGAAANEAIAPDLVFGTAVGLDMTRRDLQRAARDKRRSRDSVRNFAWSAPLAGTRPVEAAFA